jgi:NADH-quinone oxidoreductase subunit K
MLLSADVHAYLFLSFSLFAVGLYGLLSKKSLVRMLFSVEMLINSANINLAVFSAQRGVEGEVFAFFTIALAALEASVGLAIAIVFYRHFAEVLPFKIRNLRW